MPSFEIDDYRVGVTQHGDSSYASVSFDPVPSDAGPIEHGVMYFFPGASDAGYQTPTSTRYVVATPPPETFEDTYRIIRSENPVHFSWAANPTPNRLYWSTVGTGEEQPGEGPRDLSP